MDLDDLRNKIMDDITEAKMSIEVIYYLMKDMTAEITTAYNQYLVTKYKKQEEEKAKDNKEKKE